MQMEEAIRVESRGNYEGPPHAEASGRQQPAATNSERPFSHNDSECPQPVVSSQSQLLADAASTSLGTVGRAGLREWIANLLWWVANHMCPPVQPAAGCDESRLENSTTARQPLLAAQPYGPVHMEYDVFLNHRGPDVKKSFVAHLYEALKAAGLKPFLDKDDLKPGSAAFRSIDAALEVSKVHVAVVSVGYAESKHCLTELVAMLRSEKPVIPVFYDVEPAELRRVETGAFAAAFQKHRSRETEDRVREWKDALIELAGITGHVYRPSDYEGDEAELTRKVVNGVSELLAGPRAVRVELFLVGLEEHLRTCTEEVKRMSGRRCLLGLVGMGGIGKSTLARLVYNHLIKEKKFKAASFLQIKVSYQSTMEDIGTGRDQRLLGQLLEDLLCKGERSQAHQRFDVCTDKLKNLGPALVAFDDIHYLEQLEDLEPIVSALAAGSCIIATSRDRQVMKVMAREAEASYVHEVTPLGTEDSLKLLMWHAFRTSQVPENIKPAIVADVSRSSGGLPLALKVVGRNLCGKTKEEQWVDAMVALSYKDIMVTLKWSYNCLSQVEQRMFLDIAFLFCGWEKVEALKIMQSCKDCSSKYCGNKTLTTSLDHLIEKSLITEDGGVIGMHDLLQELGQNIGKENLSHLTKEKALNAVNSGWQEVRALKLANILKKMDLEKFEMMPHLDVEKFQRMPQLDVEKFRKMPDLHFLILDGFILYGNCEGSFEQVRYLQMNNTHYLEEKSAIDKYPLHRFLQDFPNLVNLSWKRCESITRAPPEFNGCSNLVTLNLSECKWMSELSDSIGNLSKLEVLNLRDCRMLVRIPDTIGCLAMLRKLNLIGCWVLEELPHLVGQLKLLESLDLMCCKELEEIPDAIGQLLSLRILDLYNCSKLKKLPDSIGQLITLEELNLESCGELEEIPDSIGQLPSLRTLRLGYCSKLKKLPDTIGELSLLELLNLEQCGELKEIPDTIGQLLLLRTLILCKCLKLKKLPKSIGELKLLQYLFLDSCREVEEIPDAIGQLLSLDCLDLENCSKLKKLPDSIGELKLLGDLSLKSCGELEEIPDTIGQLLSLEYLRLENCSKLKKLPDSIGQLKLLQHLDLGNCRELEEMPDAIGELLSLKSLWLGYCSKLKKLPDSIRQLTLLQQLDLEFCRELEDVPDAIGQLSSLELLNLNACSKLKKLPDSIGQLTLLEMLNLKFCSNLKAIPHTIGQLTSLRTLLLCGCNSLVALPNVLFQQHDVRHPKEKDKQFRNEHYMGDFDVVKKRFCLRFGYSQGLNRWFDQQINPLEEVCCNACKKSEKNLVMMITTDTGWPSVIHHDWSKDFK